MTQAQNSERRGSRARNPLVLVLLVSVCTAISFVAIQAIADEFSDPEGIPRLIPYRGHLELDGVPVDGAVELAVSLYDAETSGALLWGPETISTTAVDGDFSVMLGQSVAIDPAVFGGGDVWIGFDVDGTALAGRQRLGSVPYAMRAVETPDDECPTGYERDWTEESFVLCRRGLDEMVKVGDFWVDRYESSVWSNADCTGAQYGGEVNNWSDVEGTFPRNGQISSLLYACSVNDVFPSTHLTWFQAQAACAASGKHLITNAEWQVAVAGTQDPGASDGAGGTCNTGPGTSGRRTGLGALCRSIWGCEDMIGNEWEWTATLYGYGSSSDDGSQSAYYGNDYYWNVRAAEFPGPEGGHFPPAAVRGGSSAYGAGSGAFTTTLHVSPDNANNHGFRCARY